MLERVLPPGIVGEEVFGQAPVEPPATDGPAGAVEARKREYAAARDCARACLRRLSRPESPILTLPGGAPSWPPGVTGSLTHCPGYAAAAVGLLSEICAIGIDAEPDAPLPQGALEEVTHLDERVRLDEAPAGPDQPSWDRLLLSAKEAVFKVWSPLFAQWLDVGQVDVALEWTQRFTAVVYYRPQVAGLTLVTSFAGRWTREHGILLTSVVVPQAPASASSSVALPGG